MLDTNNPENVKRHRTRFIAIATLIFTLVGLGHFLRIMYDWTLVIGGVPMPMYISWLALVITALMALMGLAYLKR